MIAALLRGVPLTDAVVAANAAGSEAVARLGAVGEVDVAGISTVGQTLGRDSSTRWPPRPRTAEAGRAEAGMAATAGKRKDTAEMETGQ